MNSKVKSNDKVQSGQDMSSPNMVNEKHTKTTVQRVGRWYFGGVASAMAACCTHPLDLVKVHLQTISTQKESLSMSSTFVRVLKSEGVSGLYNGISASLLRQLTYSTARFGVYESAKSYILTSGKQMDLGTKIVISGSAGFFGGIIGTPGDLLNVRMQNDIKLSPESRRNYKHAVDGIVRVAREEGVRRLFGGCAMASTRGAFMSIGQMASYDSIKEQLLHFGLLKDGLICHFTCSTLAGAIATALTMPLDVMKTKMMNAKPGEFTAIWQCFRHTLRVGPYFYSAFYKGFFPAFIRLAPQTILTFVFLEQLKQHFGTPVYV